MQTQFQVKFVLVPARLNVKTAATVCVAKVTQVLGKMPSRLIYPLYCSLLLTSAEVSGE